MTRSTRLRRAALAVTAAMAFLAAVPLGLAPARAQHGGLLSLFPGAQAAEPAPAAQVAPSAPASSAPPIRVIIEVPNTEAGRGFVTEQLMPKIGGGAVATPAPSAAPPAGTDGKPAEAAAAPATSSAAATPAAAASQPATSAPLPAAAAEMSTLAGQGLDRLRDRASSLVMAAPRVPEDISAAFHLFVAMGNRLHLRWMALAFVVFAGGGFLARQLAWWSARGLLTRIMNAPGETPGQRVRLFGMRLTVAVYVLSAFLMGSLGAFLLFPWPPVFREIVLSLLGVTVAIGFANAVGRVLIAPGARHDYFRVLPLTTRRAVFWYRWLLIIVSTIAIGAAAISVLRIIALPAITRDVILMGWRAVVIGLLITALWQRQAMRDEPPVSRILAVVLTVDFVLMWVFAAMELWSLFATLAVFTIVPLLANLVRGGVRNVVRLNEPGQPQDSAVITWAVLVERAIRLLLVIGGALVLARAWGVDLNDIAMGETGFTRVVRALVRIVIIVLVADLAWRLIRAVIDGRLDDDPALPLHDDSPEARRRQRLRTLLPILRNFLLVIIGAITVLTVLDSLGIQIGPLLAGAGVVGIAIGFGAQTLVKDIISGVFYLLDDAFRVGEYIQAGSHRGTVESFSIRSVKLRHHRGPISTVPFGELGAVQNLSRDWVIDKFTIGVTYDTDLEKARKIVKKIGQTLAADPEFSANILEPLKMQGVEQMGDYAIQLRLKMMTRPGEQFVIRRKAYAMLKQAFQESGIQFAFPTVRVSGGEHFDPNDLAAAAQSAIGHQKPAPAA
ncbi:mechanosensitive ion channel family protein [Alsobacter sp. SYSU M60028]|uniref:Mechanosensitive ion channel family protein n=1 Tax=Alsobacter ponti TaxID=2962936 RepID=A0ABT1LHP2_9HYPH|nr:mechanosensitive ion channel domain-containing protein [Alsobacter ponti]MCP8941027.1 mechanosensitive ion channel family protein [Alsobacter ponti]